MIVPTEITICRAAALPGGLWLEWEALLARLPACSQAQSPAYCAIALAQARAPHTKPLLIAAWQSARLIGIWPLWVTHDRGVRTACHINGGSKEEYGGPLVETPAVLPAMLAAARIEADVLHLCNIPIGSPLIPLAAGLATHVQPIVSSVVRCAGAGSLEAWLAGRSSSLRQRLRSNRKQLAAQGVLRDGPVLAGEIDSFTDWLFDAKCGWADARGMGASWLREARARAFMKCALRDPRSGVVAHGLWLDDKPIAGAFSLVGAVFEFFVFTYDTAYARCSPGHVLTGDLVGAAITAGLDFDFRMSDDAYKARWADDADRRATLTIACTMRGWPTVARAHLRDARRRLAAVKRRIATGVRFRRHDPKSPSA